LPTSSPRLSCAYRTIRPVPRRRAGGDAALEDRSAGSAISALAAVDDAFADPWSRRGRESSAPPSPDAGDSAVARRSSIRCERLGRPVDRLLGHRAGQRREIEGRVGLVATIRAMRGAPERDAISAAVRRVASDVSLISDSVAGPWGQVWRTTPH
jgi:hypothetical protein